MPPTKCLCQWHYKVINKTTYIPCRQRPDNLSHEEQCRQYMSAFSYQGTTIRTAIGVIFTRYGNLASTLVFAVKYFCHILLGQRELDGNLANILSN